MAEAFPLAWPAGWPRTPDYKRTQAPYTVSGEQARKELLHELKLLGAKNVVISSNVPVRGDGMPYADAARRRIDDPGVALYFERNGERKVLACDKWHKPDSNIRALGLAIAGMRAMSRAGVSELLDRAFTGFKALPAPGQTSGSTYISQSEQVRWFHILEVAESASREVIEAAYRTKAKSAHPDAPGGSHDAMARLNAARSEGQQEVARRARAVVA